MADGAVTTARDEIELRDAVDADLPAIVALLANDPLGMKREDPSGRARSRYAEALATISVDPNHHLLVASIDGEVVGVLQLSFLPHLTYRGGWRAQIEGVRVSSRSRSRRVGRRLVRSAIERARERGCHLVAWNS